MQLPWLGGNGCRSSFPSAKPTLSSGRTSRCSLTGTVARKLFGLSLILFPKTWSAMLNVFTPQCREYYTQRKSQSDGSHSSLPCPRFPSPVRNTSALQVSHGTVPPRNPRRNRETDKRFLSPTISPCDASAMTPACLQYLYNIPVTPALNESNLLYVTGFTDEWPQRTDLSVRTTTFPGCPII